MENQFRSKPNSFYTVNNTYIRTSDPKGFVSSFKTLDQSSAANSNYGADKDRMGASGGKVVDIGHPMKGVHYVKDCIH